MRLTDLPAPIPASLPPGLEAGLRAYAGLLRDYAPALDLVSGAFLSDLDEKLLDALAYLAPLDATPGLSGLLDLGSGAGLPGVPLALARPAWRVHLVEVRSRRAAFLETAAARLGLKNVTVHRADVRRVNAPVQAVTAQAVGRLGEVVALAAHLDPALVASRKGADEVTDESAGLPGGWAAEAFPLRAAPGGRSVILAARRAPVSAAVRA
ncbi:MAG TPA: RsmG family class I SAM-dependent methyltransferase [Deinococcales bacterium]|nr:RsmG family class I SAM-dependent methyltransferase [Deinococcales bacterium]